jgi:hypothetical protein
MPAGTDAQPFLKLRARDLSAITPHLALPPPPAACIAAAQGTPEALEALRAAGFLLEASRLLAHALPHREAVWWACMCAAHTAPADLAAADRDAGLAAESWVRRPGEALCRAAMARAQSAGFASPESWAAVAAFWSGDSLAPPDQHKVPPPPHLAGIAVAGAVALASVRGDPARAPARLERFLASAHEIAGGGAGRLPPEGR